jgi:hypothetical protein
MIQIRNWGKFQHFKNRRPPWIKLYRDLLDDPDWHELNGETAKILTMIWLVASEDETKEGKIHDIKKLSFRLRIGEHELIEHLQLLTHWLDFTDINLLSTRYQHATPEGETEGETEGELKTEKEKPLLEKLEPLMKEIDKTFKDFNPYQFHAQKSQKQLRPIECWIDLWERMLSEKDNIQKPWAWCEKVYAVEAQNVEASMAEERHEELKESL